MAIRLGKTDRDTTALLLSLTSSATGLPKAELGREIRRIQDYQFPGKGASPDAQRAARIFLQAVNDPQPFDFLRDALSQDEDLAKLAAVNEMALLKLRLGLDSSYV